jgi:PAS domain-containing protein
MYRDDSFIVFPLIDEAKNVVGLLSLHNKKSPPFTRQDLDLGQIMVSLGSEALQKQLAAEALRRKEEHLARLATAVEQADENVMITDTSGTIVYVNPSFTRITGYTPDEAIGRTPGSSRAEVTTRPSTKGCGTPSAAARHGEGGLPTGARTGG